MTKPHKHAEFLRAIADGVPPSEFEGRFLRRDGGWSEWIALEDFSIPMITVEIRRKQKTITVNGFEVPEPLRVMPEIGTTYFAPSVSGGTLYVSDKVLNHVKEYYGAVIFNRGLMHLTKEAAIAHAKAMLGIDPNAPEKVADVSTSAAWGAE